MSRSTSVRVVNESTLALRLDGVSVAAGRWRGQPPPALLPAGATAVFTTASRNRFGGTEGMVRYLAVTSKGRARTLVATPASEVSVELHWNNPFVGQNSYRMDVTGKVLGVVCDGIDDASEAIVNFSIIPARRVAVAGFVPSRNAFRFTNSWTNEPLKRVNLKVGSIPIGDASRGLCGGMALAARDWFEARQPIPTMTKSPPDKHPVRTFIIERLIDSYDLPDGVLPYIKLTTSHYPDHDSEVLATFGQLHSRAALLARSTWPKVRDSIDAGYPCPLGLIMVKSDDPRDLKHQHQVLAYAYQLRGTAVTIWVYDPNSPLDDNITIRYDTSRTDRTIDITHNVDSTGPMVCAFPVRYTAKMPPQLPAQLPTPLPTP